MGSHVRLILNWNLGSDTGTCSRKAGFSLAKLGRKPMTNLKTLAAIAVLSAAIATPALAQDFGVLGPGSRDGLTPQPGPTYHHAQAYYHRSTYHHRSGFRGAYNRWNGHYDPEFRRNKEDFGFSGRDRSRVGGEAPWLHPSGD
jgi:hypothetical protein